MSVFLPDIFSKSKSRAFHCQFILATLPSTTEQYPIQKKSRGAAEVEGVIETVLCYLIICQFLPFPHFCLASSISSASINCFKFLFKKKKKKRAERRRTILLIFLTVEENHFSNTSFFFLLEREKFFLFLLAVINAPILIGIFCSQILFSFFFFFF